MPALEALSPDPGNIVVWCNAAPVPVPSGVFEDHQKPRSLIRFIGPIREEWKDALAASGFRIEFWAPPFGACVTLPAGLRPAALARFPFVAGAVEYTLQHKLPLYRQSQWWHHLPVLPELPGCRCVTVTSNRFPSNFTFASEAFASGRNALTS